ncbi:MAG: GNAT family N-acetyltransferase, partial [Chthonomonas sp.]|nr:GNAT family N-acetyltransferase [Chthonomonas sp.]
VCESLQGSGIGALMVAESERMARELGFARMVLHARETAVGFYLRLGYACEGESFEEVGIPHRLMQKEL